MKKTTIPSLLVSLYLAFAAVSVGYADGYIHLNIKKGEMLEQTLETSSLGDYTLFCASNRFRHTDPGNISITVNPDSDARSFELSYIQQDYTLFDIEPDNERRVLVLKMEASEDLSQDTYKISCQYFNYDPLQQE